MSDDDNTQRHRRRARFHNETPGDNAGGSKLRNATLILTAEQTAKVDQAREWLWRHKKSWDDWELYVEVLLMLKRECLAVQTKGKGGGFNLMYSRVLKEHELDNDVIDKYTRAAMFKIRDNYPEIMEFIRANLPASLKWNHPRTVVDNWTAHKKHKAETDEDGNISALTRDRAVRALGKTIKRKVKYGHLDHRNCRDLIENTLGDIPNIPREWYWGLDEKAATASPVSVKLEWRLVNAWELVRRARNDYALFLSRLKDMADAYYDIMDCFVPDRHEYDKWDNLYWLDGWLDGHIELRKLGRDARKLLADIGRNPKAWAAEARQHEDDPEWQAKLDVF